MILAISGTFLGIKPFFVNNCYIIPHLEIQWLGPYKSMQCLLKLQPKTSQHRHKEWTDFHAENHHNLKSTAKTREWSWLPT